MFLCLLVVLMSVIIIPASLHDTHLKNCKMWPTVESIGIFNLTKYPCPYVHVRVHKERRYLFQKFKGKNNRPLYGIRNNTCPSFFISHPSPVLPIPDKTNELNSSPSKLPTSSKSPTKLGYHFDSDSFKIGVDNHSSFTISNNVHHFAGKLRPYKAKLLGIGGISAIHGRGTIRWTFDDDDGYHHTIVIKDAIYVPSAPICLLSPQHWAQVAKDHSPLQDGTWCATFSKSVVLHWDQYKFSRTIPICPKSNTHVFISSTGTSQARCSLALFDTHCKTPKLERTFAYTSNTPQPLPNLQPPSQIDTPPSLLCQPVSENDNEDDASVVFLDPSIAPRPPSLIAPPPVPIPPDPVPLIAQFPLPTFPTAVDEDNEDLTTLALTPQAELLRWHYHLAHRSFKILRLLAYLRIIPYHLRLVRPLMCASCKYGNMTRQPWTVQGAANRGKIHPTSQAGECVSVNQIESFTSGFLAQVKVHLTRRRYRVATVFLDHFSDLSYVHLQTSTNGSDTLESNKAFEAYARLHNVTIRHYHANNGRFVEHKWVHHCQDSGQTISYCAAYAHFQNGKAEKRIRDLQEQARNILLHAIIRWQSAVTIHLWPYALCHANDVRNAIPSQDDVTSSLDRFASVKLPPRLRLYHTFGCPIFALSERLQNGSSIPKWSPRARMGVYLGTSPRHARSVSLILSLSTGLCSPQFHVSHDEFFETTRSNQHLDSSSKWQALSGLSTDMTLPPAPSKLSPSEGAPLVFTPPPSS